MKTPSKQLSLFDESGMPSIDIDRATIEACNVGSDFELAGMKFKITHEDPHTEFLKEVLEALRNLHRLKDQISCPSWLSGIGTLVIDEWKDEFRALVRSNQHRGIIEVTQRKEFVEISLPHPDLWSAHGLDWMRKFQNCCARNKVNSSPWLGACCGCPPRL